MKEIIARLRRLADNERGQSSSGVGDLRGDMTARRLEQIADDLERLAKEMGWMG